MRITLIASTLCFTLSTQVHSIDWPSDTFSELDYGLYWFDGSNNYEKATSGQSNAYYDPASPTVIYIHGWQSESTEDEFRESFDWTHADAPDQIMSNAWWNAGYNIGILYWNQFADESEVKDAEAKIWTASGPKDMRYRLSDGSYEQLSGNDNVTDLLFDDLVGFMDGNFYGSEFRIVGHSLGSQVAIRLADELFVAADNGNISSNLVPDRVALLDPFFSNDGKDYLGGNWTGEESRWLVFDLIDEGMAFEAYRSSSTSSSVFVGDDNQALLDSVAFIELEPWYFWFWEQTEKHIAAAWHYFWSFEFAPPTIRRSSDEGASASTSTSRIIELMSSDQSLNQYSGQYTESPSDDVFEYQNR